MYRAAAAALILFAALVAAPAASPIQVSYVYSDSMEPTIPESGGFLVVPAGEVQIGEIIVFKTAPDEPVTAHRVVGETERGFITQGDNNNVPDQETGHPYVQREDVRGQVFAIGGEPVVVPELGILISAVRSNVAVLLVAIAGLGAVSSWTGGRSRGRGVIDSEWLLRFVFVTTVLTLSLLVLLGGTGTQLTFLAVDGTPSEPGQFTTGEPMTPTVTIAGATRNPLMTPAVSAEGATVTDRTWKGSDLEAGVRVPPRDSPGTEEISIAVYRYPSVLPPSVLGRLQGVHPALAALISAALAMAPLYLLGRLLFGAPVPLRGGRSRRFRRLFDI